MMKAIFLHGLGQKAFHWKGVGQRLSVDYEAWELTYFHRYPPSFHHLVNHLRRRLQGEDEVLLVGLSLGAMLALEVMRKPPSSVKGLVLSGVHLDVRHHVGRYFLQEISRFGPKGLYARLGLSRGNFYGFLKSLETYCVLDILPQIDVPTRILCGTRDAPARKNTLILAREMPRAKVQWIAHRGHLLNENAEEEFAQAIEKTLLEIKKSP